MNEFPDNPNFHNTRNDDLRLIIKDFVFKVESEEDKRKLANSDKPIGVWKHKFARISESDIRTVYRYYLEQYQSLYPNFIFDKDAVQPSSIYNISLNALINASKKYDKIKGIENIIQDRLVFLQLENFEPYIELPSSGNETMKLHFQLKKDIIPIQLFNELRCDEIIPFAIAKWKKETFYKFDTALPFQKSWSGLTLKENSVLLFVFNNETIQQKTKTIKKKYTICQLEETVLNDEISYTLKVEYHTLFGMTRKELIHKITKKINRFYFEDIDKTIETDITYRLLLTNFVFDKTTFADFITFDDDIRHLIFADESHETIVHKNISSFYLVKNLGEELIPDKAITITFTQTSDGFFDATIKNAENSILLETLIQRLRNIFSLYAYKRSEIEAEYISILGRSIEDFISGEKDTVIVAEERRDRKTQARLAELILDLGNGDKKIGNHKYTTLLNTSPEDPNFQYTKACPIEKRPYILNQETKDDFLRAKKSSEEMLASQGKTPQEIAEYSKHLTKEWEGYMFACIPRRNKTEEKYIFPHLSMSGKKPCCTTGLGIEKEEKAGKKSVQKRVLTKKSVQFGTATKYKPLELNRILKIAGGDYLNYSRYNLGKSNDTFLRCMLYALGGGQYQDISEEDFENHLSFTKIFYNIENTEYINPIIYAPILSNMSNITDINETFNIVLFEMTNDVQHCDFRYSPGSHSFDANLRTIIIMYHPSITQPDEMVCELIIDPNGKAIIEADNQLNIVLNDMIFNGFDLRIIVDNNKYY